MLLALALAACAPQTAPHAFRQMDGPRPTAPNIRVSAARVPLDPNNPTHIHLGAFTYAGGFELTSPDTARLHGLSDLKVAADGGLVAESDEGDLLRARLVLDAQGWPTRLTDATLVPLTGPDGQALQGKDEADAEGVAIMPNGDLLVSFERHDRILDYPAAGGAPHPVPAPDVRFLYNLGMEALAADPEAGSDAYRVGGEFEGRTWVCHLAGGCTAAFKVPKPIDYGLSALAPLPGGRTAYLIRGWDPLRGGRATVTIRDARGAEIDRLELGRPLTVDNFEGLAAVSGKDGSVRFYLISDDNFSTDQRTLLLAFDWSPRRP